MRVRSAMQGTSARDRAIDIRHTLQMIFASTASVESTKHRRSADTRLILSREDTCKSRHAVYPRVNVLARSGQIYHASFKRLRFLLPSASRGYARREIRAAKIDSSRFIAARKYARALRREFLTTT